VLVTERPVGLDEMSEGARAARVVAWQEPMDLHAGIGSGVLDQLVEVRRPDRLAAAQDLDRDCVRALGRPPLSMLRSSWSTSMPAAASRLSSASGAMRHDNSLASSATPSCANNALRSWGNSGRPAGAASDAPAP
jgi:hypothetical protein